MVGRCGRYEGLEEELDLLQIGAGRQVTGERRRRTENVRLLKVETRRAAGGEDCRSGTEGSGELSWKKVQEYEKSRGEKAKL